MTSVDPMDVTQIPLSEKIVLEPKEFVKVVFLGCSEYRRGINLLSLIIQYAAGFCVTKPVQIWYSTSLLNCDKTLSLLTSK